MRVPLLQLSTLTEDDLERLALMLTGLKVAGSSERPHR